MAGAAGHRTAQLSGRGLAVAGALEQTFLTGLAEELEQSLRGPPEGAGRVECP